MTTSFGKFAPNKSAGKCVEHKPYHPSPKPSVSKGVGTTSSITLPTVDSKFNGSKPFSKTGKG